MAPKSPAIRVKKQSPTSSSQSSSDSDASDSSHDPDLASNTSALSPSDMDYSTHGDLRSVNREFARDRQLRKKSRTHSSSALATPDEHLTPSPQPVIPGDPDAVEKKPQKMSKKQQLRSHENIKKSNKREDRRKSVDRRQSTDEHAAEGDDVAIVESGLASLEVVDKPPKHRRKSSTTTGTHNHSHNKPSHHRKHSATSAGTVKSPTSPPLQETRPGLVSPKQSSYDTQYHVDEGIHERSGDLDAQMRRMAQIEAEKEYGRSGRLARAIEEIDGRQRDRRREEALRGVVEGAVEKWEGRAD